MRGYLFDPAPFDAELIKLGVMDPWFIQFLRYLGRFFMGDWGSSFLVSEGTPTIELMRRIVPKTIETMLVPIIIGLLGIKLGRISVQKRNRVPGYIIRIFTVISLAIPIIFLIPGMQIFFEITLRNFTRGVIEIPVIYYVDPILTPPPFITGFPFFDSVVSGNWVYAESILLHGIFSTIVLIIVLLPIIIKQTQTNIERNLKGTSFLTNSYTAIKLFGILFTYVFLLEIFCNRTGLAYYFWTSFILRDIFFFNGCILVLVIISSFLVFFSNVIPITYKFLRGKIIRSEFLKEKVTNKINPIREKLRAKLKLGRKTSTPTLDSEGKIELKSNPSIKTELKSYIMVTLKNPFIIVGLGLLIFLISISAFPQLITPYSLQEIIPPFFPPDTPFSPPTLNHPLGTTRYGYDLLARVLYGIQGAFIFGLVVVLIGLAGGSIFGFIAGMFHRHVNNAIIGSMITFLMIPAIGLFLLIAPLFGFSAILYAIGIGVLLIPIFTRLIANAIKRGKNFLDKAKIIIKYIPLEMVFAILLFQSIGFLGLMDGTNPQLGITISYGLGSFGAIYFILWPSFFLFLILLSLLLLHEGLKLPTLQQKVMYEETRI
ncbi:MAG: hypothetical protein ACXAAI_13925 [Promethearchaeota archaeon]